MGLSMRVIGVRPLEILTTDHYLVSDKIDCFHYDNGLISLLRSVVIFCNQLSLFCWYLFIYIIHLRIILPLFYLFISFTWPRGLTNLIYIGLPSLLAMLLCSFPKVINLLSCTAFLSSNHSLHAHTRKTCLPGS